MSRVVAMLKRAGDSASQSGSRVDTFIALHEFMALNCLSKGSSWDGFHSKLEFVEHLHCFEGHLLKYQSAVSQIKA